MRREPRLRQALSFLRVFPLHPQWFVYRGEAKSLAALASIATGTVLDIGCADQKPRRYLSDRCTYIGLDHYTTASQWYGTRPQVYGDAMALPFPDNCFETVLLIDVLEHVPDAMQTVSEISRVVKSGGVFVLQVPFMYPLHDAPRDFQRWTLYGLRELAQRFGFVVESETSLGNAIESAALLANLGLCHAALEGLRRRRPAAMLSLVVPAFVLGTNLLAWLVALVVRRDDFMAHGFRLVLRRA